MPFLVDENVLIAGEDAARLPGWHMSVDQWMLEHGLAEHPGEIMLRLYRWPLPTLSLGYFQPFETRWSHEASRQALVVRRASGGGAILHENEITYSVAIAHSRLRELSTTAGWQRLASKGSDQLDSGSAPLNQRLYRVVHQLIIDALAKVSVQASRFADQPKPTVVRDHQPPKDRNTQTETDDDDRFLCFQRRTDDDLIVGGYKVVGSAQRRGRHGILQHGSILWECSPRAPELPGISNLCTSAGKPSALDEFHEILCLSWSGVLGQTPEKLVLDANQVRTIDKIRSDRFNNQRWLKKR